MLRRLAPALLAASALAEDAAPAPARFVVTDQVVNPDPGAFTATTAPAKLLLDMPCEPMVWRKAFGVGGGRPGIIEAPSLDWYDSYAGGYWDGARARVLRARAGRLEQVLDGEVSRYVRGTWSPVGGGLVPAGATAAELAFEGWAGHDQDWWFAVAAVDKAGRESPRSAPVLVHDPDLPGAQRGKAREPQWMPPPKAAPATVAAAGPAVPAGFSAGIDPATAVVSLSWQAAAGEVAGYRLYRTFIDPATHAGHHLVLGSRGGGEAFRASAGDLLILDRRACSFSKNWFSPRVRGAIPAYPPSCQPEFGARRTPVSWELVPHPGALPADAADAGRTCLRFSAPAGGVTAIRRYNHSGTWQNWYPVLDPDETYVVELLARQDGLASGAIRFCLTGALAARVPVIALPVDGAWRRLRAEFRVPERLTGKDGGVGQMCLEVEGPGTVFIDCWRVYAKSDGLGRFNAADRAAIADSGIAAIRTHDTIKSEGYTLDDLLGHPDAGLSSGKEVFGRANLPALLSAMRDLHVDPWLQLEPTLDEAEWDGLVQYLAAPWDPARDRAEERPWAARRAAHGQVRPFADEFRRILIEVGNEMWNPIMPIHVAGLELVDAADGTRHGSGAVYGMWQEYCIQAMKRSRWWTPELERKVEFVIGGWAINSFGYEAARRSPSSRHVLVADYNGGWDAGEGPESDRDAALRKTLLFGVQAGRPNAIRLRGERDQCERAGGRRLAIGSYEAGPGYNMNGLNGARMTPEMVEFESRVMKSLAAGTATLDCFLAQAEQGAGLQNFFTFGRNRHYWTSHAQARNGGQAYPSWMALALHNRFATGDHLKVLTLAVPATAAAAVGHRKALADAPEVGVYATRSGDRLAVFVLSRRLEGALPVELELPITAARSVRLHALAGDPRAHNLDREEIRPAVVELPMAVAGRHFVLDAARGAPGGLPPAASLLYVFAGCTFLPSAPSVTVVPAPGQMSPANSLPLRFRVAANRPLAIAASDLVLTGAAEPQGCIVSEVPGSYGHEHEVTVSEVMGEGEVRVALRDGRTIDGQALPPAAGAATLLLPTGTLLPLLAWNFAAVQQADWRNTPIPCTRRLPVAAPAALAASKPSLLGGNRWHNDDGAGTWSASLAAEGPLWYGFTLTPAAGRILDLGRIEAGLWAVPKHPEDALQAELQVLRDGAVVATVPFIAAAPLRSRGIAASDGIGATAEVSTVAALQGLAQPVELRIVLGGLARQGGVFGIGKRGRAADDLVVLGRVRSP
jgi:hypothetical protein